MQVPYEQQEPYQYTLFDDPEAVPMYGIYCDARFKIKVRRTPFDASPFSASVYIEDVPCSREIELRRLATISSGMLLEIEVRESGRPFLI